LKNKTLTFGMITAAILVCQTWGSAGEPPTQPKIPRWGSPAEAAMRKTISVDITLPAEMKPTTEYRPRLPLFRAAPIQMSVAFMKAFMATTFDIKRATHVPGSGPWTFMKDSGKRGHNTDLGGACVYRAPI